jgi:hypothetical protein
MNTRSKYLIIELVAFTLVSMLLIILIKIVLAWGIKHSDDSQTGKVNLIMQEKTDPEIIIFGSSVAEVGFNSNLIRNITNMSVYNSAIDGTRFYQYKYLIKKYTSYSVNNKYIILGLSFFSLSPADKLTEPSRFYAYLNKSPIKDMFLSHDKTEYFKLRYLPFYAYSQYSHTYYKNFIIGTLNIIKNKQLIPDQLNGFVPVNSSWHGNEADTINKEKINITSETLNNISKLISIASKKNIKVILIISPLYIKAQKHFSNYDHFKTTIKEFQNNGAIIYDFSNDSINFDKKYFYNNGHLNVIGANIFSKKVAEKLLRINKRL